MSKIHIASGPGQSTVHEEHEVAEMLRQGRIGPETLCWRQGMPDWRPIRTVMSEVAYTGKQPPPIPSTGFRFARDPRGLTTALNVMLVIQLIVAVVSIVSDYAQLELARGTITIEAALANDSRQQMVFWISLAVFVVTGVLFLRWIHMANVNCRGFGAQGMEFTPGWSIGYYFIPFLNLVRPFQAMREIWKASSNPSSWPSQPGSALLGWWWFFWLATGILGQVYFRMAREVNSPASLESATQVALASSVAEILLIIVAMMLISKIISMQTRLARG